MLLGLVLAMALWLRLHDLAARPMHADEANQAVKLGQLLETGHYAFDPRDHHGPTLYYFALLPAWVRGETTLAALRETTIRLTPAVFGTVVVLLIYLLGQPLGRGMALLAATFTALSPPAVYYSRDFIQETLLVAFTLGALVCGQRWWRRGRWPWAISAGICAGLMQATKATALLWGGAALITLVMTARRGGERPASRHCRRDALLALATAAAVAALFYTSFLAHPKGLLDAFAAYGYGLTRATGGGTGQEKPWWYYTSLFLFQRRGGLIWDQSLFLALALAGLLIGLLSSRVPLTGRWLALDTALLALVLSATPYKTPWIIVNLVPGFALLAALALSRLRTWLALPLAAAVLLLLGWQTRQAVFQRPADPHNPLAYVQTAPDMLTVPALAAATPPGPIKVISEEYWPLPWYLRRRPQVGYWTKPPADCDGVLVFASADLAGKVRARLHGSYREDYLGLRPGFVLVVFARR